MCDHTRKLSHISLSQGKIFSFYSDLGHFQSHVVPKNHHNKVIFLINLDLGIFRFNLVIFKINLLIVHIT